MGEGREYQRDFSEIHPKTMFDELGRLQKARKTVAVILDALRQAGIDPRETRLLDIGCSTGILTRHYAEFFGWVVGIDIDDGAVEWARKNRAAENVSYRIGDSLEVPFPTGEFDLVTCTHIYEHVPDAQRMLDEIHRVLRPGGILFFRGRESTEGVGRTLRPALRDRAARIARQRLCSRDGPGPAAL